MLIFVADPNHGIMKCGLMDKMSVPRVLSTTKWSLLCNKERIKLAGARLSAQRGVPLISWLSL